MRKNIGILLVVVLYATSVCAQIDESICIVYFTGIGCPHCAKTDPVVLEDLPPAYGGQFVVIEYEIYQQQENAHVMYDYHTTFDSKLGVPQTISGEGQCVVGDESIIEKIPHCIEENRDVGIRCQLLDRSVPFSQLDVTTLPGSPKIWMGGRILMKTGDTHVDGAVLRDLLFADDVVKAVEDIKGAELIEAAPVPLSGKSVPFLHAADLGGWTLQWGRAGQTPSTPVETASSDKSGMPMNPATLLVIAFIFVLGLGIVKKLRGGT